MSNKTDLPNQVKAVTSSITTKYDANGQPISFETFEPSKDDPNLQVIWSSQKMTDGTWSSEANGYWRVSGKYAGEMNAPEISSIQSAKDGTVTIKTQDGYVRTFTPGGEYQIHSDVAQHK